MTKYGNVTVLPAEPNPWADAFSLIGSVMGKNAAGRQDAKDADLAVGIYGPQPNQQGGLISGNNGQNAASADVQIPAQQGGLLSGGNVKDNITASLAPNTSFLDGQSSPTTQATPMQAQTVTPTQAMQQPASIGQQATQATQPAKPLTRSDAINQYNANWAQQMRSIYAKMSPEGRAKYGPQLMATREEGLKQYLADYDKQTTASNWDAFNAETSPTKKIQIANKLGLPIESVKFALQPDTEVKQVVDLGGNKLIVGVNRYTGQAINMANGQPVTADDLQNTMTPYQAGYLSNQAAGIAAKGSYGYGGGSGGNANTQKAAMYKWAAGYELQPTGETDAMGKPVMTRVQRNPELAKQLYAELFGNGEGGEPGNGGGADYNEGISKVTAALGKGLSKEQIIQAVRQDYGDMADIILTDSGLLGDVQADSSSGIDLSAPTFGSNDETLVDYLNNGTWLEDMRKKNANIGKE